MKKVALLSVYEKRGIVELASGLIDHNYDIICTEGTYKMLVDNRIDVKRVSEVIGAPEMIDGRVKTLHPSVFAGILAKRNNDKHMSELKENNIAPIDLVVCNLYPFYKAAYELDMPEDDVLEYIDIGGVSLIRAAAKNFRDVAAVIDPDDYKSIIEEMDEEGNILNITKRRELAAKAFRYTMGYDSLISKYFGKDVFAGQFGNSYKKTADLRYGENPHQRSALYKDMFYNAPSFFTAEKLHGKQLSYNNIVDLEAAKNIVIEFDGPACTIVKHSNPCGVAVADTIVEAYRSAYIADPISAYGSIVALNRKVDMETASEIKSNFVEVLIAPDFDDEAFSMLATKKNIRLIKYKDMKKSVAPIVYKHITGGLLVQENDIIEEDDKTWRIVSERESNDKEWKALKFAWKVAKHVKSNAIVLATESRTYGIGAGQMSRVDACELAVKKSNAVGSYTGGTAMASDGFFPFRDSIDIAHEAGISCVIEPGGSIRDGEVIDACNEHGMALIFTGIRHFKH
ncbi:MAG: bifunctional phosphoribosylaminoimidazolecarboxamide formyltransferase/IMP cyclohydrolase [Proteobacteria bacterium]|nr:bifunctional phosphoribosylaminoimidazolecarboxamide formyltransferase/IMP cyclohydrolase [Pseudomonadota bacterium]